MRRRMLLGTKEIPNYGGIPIGVDKAYLTPGGQTRYSISEFITTFAILSGVGHSITFGYQTRYEANSENLCEYYDDYSFADYWGQRYPTRTFTLTTRILRVAVQIQYAENFFVFDNTDGVYIFKGNAVI